MSDEKFNELLSDVSTTLAERRSQHGNFVDQANVSQLLLDVMRGSSNYAYLTAHQRESLAMIQIKIARILEGDCNYIDHWHDIAGYAMLVERALGQEQEKREVRMGRTTLVERLQIRPYDTPSIYGGAPLPHNTEVRDPQDPTEINAAIERRCIKGETAK